LVLSLGKEIEKLESVEQFNGRLPLTV